MRMYGILICSVLLMAMVFLPGCTTQDTGHPAVPAAPEGVKGNPFGHITRSTVRECTSPPRNANAPGCLCNGYRACNGCRSGADTGYRTGSRLPVSQNHMHGQ